MSNNNEQNAEQTMNNHYFYHMIKMVETHSSDEGGWSNVDEETTDSFGCGMDINDVLACYFSNYINHGVTNDYGDGDCYVTLSRELYKNDTTEEDGGSLYIRIETVYLRVFLPIKIVLRGE